MNHNLFPYNFEKINSKYYLVTSLAGDFFFCNEQNLQKLLNKNIDENFSNFLISKNFLFGSEGDFYWNNFKYKILKRKILPKTIGYYMIVPTLRCNLNCSYCQVSRVDENTKGYDWDDEILKNFFNFVKKNSLSSIKVEFQGGEPTLRIDIIEKIINWCEQEKIDAEFAICTNLINFNKDIEKIVANEKVHISTSIDGSHDIQNKQRADDKERTSQFFKNFDYISNKYGIEKISALPTFYNFDQIKPTIDFYYSLGLRTIYLRPVNFQGFARKKHPESKTQINTWNEYYFEALNYIFENNYKNKNSFIMEFAFATNLRRVFQKGSNGHLDIRNPNFAGRDNYIIDFDGKLYPSDEARMISRIGLVDLSMGDIVNGPEKEKINNYNWNQISDVNPDCIHCSFQPYCGIDSVDDISRYNRIDLPKHKTSFCNNHISKFRDIFSRIVSNDPVNIFNLTGHLTNIFTLNPPFSKIIYD